MRASLVAHMVKNLCPGQETQVQSRGRQEPLEEGMATHSSTLAWRSPWTEAPGGLQPMSAAAFSQFQSTIFTKCH